MPMHMHRRPTSRSSSVRRWPMHIHTPMHMHRRPTSRSSSVRRWPYAYTHAHAHAQTSNLSKLLCETLALAEPEITPSTTALLSWHPLDKENVRVYHASESFDFPTGMCIVYTRMCACALCAHVCLHVHVHTCVCMFMCTHACACTHMRVHVHTCVCMCTHACVCAHVHVHVHVVPRNP